MYLSNDFCNVPCLWRWLAILLMMQPNGVLASPRTAKQPVAVDASAQKQLGQRNNGPVRSSSAAAPGLSRKQRLRPLCRTILVTARNVAVSSVLPEGFHRRRFSYVWRESMRVEAGRLLCFSVPLGTAAAILSGSVSSGLSLWGFLGGAVVGAAISAASKVSSACADVRQFQSGLHCTLDRGIEMLTTDRFANSSARAKAVQFVESEWQYFADRWWSYTPQHRRKKAHFDRLAAGLGLVK